MLEAEAVALLLLLRRRRQFARELLSPARVEAAAEQLRQYLYWDILGIRQAGRFAGLVDMQLAWGQLPGVSVAEQLEDSLRARRFSERFADLVRSEAGERGALGILDNRLTTIGITENASAFNAQRRIAAEHIAERLGLVEIWDATLDKRTCDVCWSMNGEHAVIGVGFPGGMVPGLVHPRCRCTSHFDRIN